MTSTTCGWCGSYAHMTAASGLHSVPLVFPRGEIQAAYTCDQCDLINVASESADIRFQKPQKNSSDETAKYEWDSQARWLPTPDRQRRYLDVPQHIASAATEATLCLSTGAYRAVGSLARAVVEATGEQQGHKVRGIKNKIDAMAAANVLRPLVAEQAHEIRHFGNDMAHGDFLTPTTREEADEIITLMDEVLREVFQAPAQLARVKKTREDKRAVAVQKKDVDP